MFNKTVPKEKNFVIIFRPDAPIAISLLSAVSVCPVDKSIYTGYTQKNGAVSKVNKKFISHLTRAQLAPSAAATVQVSHALPAVRF